MALVQSVKASGELVNTGLGTVSVDATLAAPPTEGQTLVALVIGSIHTTGTATITGAEGWTKQADDGGSNIRIEVWTKIAGADESATSNWKCQTNSGSAGADVALIALVAEFDGESVVIGTEWTPDGSTTLDIPGVELTVAGDYAVLVGNAGSNNAFTFNPETELYDTTFDAEGATSVLNGTVAMAHASADVGATGTINVTATTGTSANYGIVVGVNGAPPAPSGPSQRSKMWRLILGSYPGLGN